ncbi:O-succinylbenzoic acid-CoA ligase (MenE) [Hymenobacter roseosalivarius DSM 11622]|uniref:O-succinylbenzoic acid-CoA ligase (MenE) n=1 Tax=Hymenobacter roseosalivarius DSM 11622 TaxID=645990 RepID=A0A1W1VXA5_9BACT|nr:AMP-binding protein [Hymenobacter roseosalivarius]SMB97966.1 O-succinylbenzoic acid-CoA ligase (MenE) [Hymenobacter roseosalivarius DSM 11622]
MPTSTLIPDFLLLNGREFRYSDIKQYPANTPVDLNGYEAKVLDFCRQWLNGTLEFGLQTSGSTGEPQRIQMRRQQLAASAHRTADYFDLGPGDRMLVCLNCEYVGGLMMLVRGLELNLHLTIVEPHADPLALVPAEAAFDFVSFVPLQLRTVLENGHAARLNAMKAILVGGAAVESGLARAAQALAVPVYHTYGMTETASHIALRRLNGSDASPYYKVLPGIHVAEDEHGCLTVRADVTDDQLITTNDQVRLLPEEHAFEWLGRADFVINSGGVKVQAEKVEQVLEVALAELNLPPRRAFVAARPDERLGEQVTAFLEGDALSGGQSEQLLALLTERLGRYERPRELVYVPEFKTTASGKLDRRGTVALFNY